MPRYETKNDDRRRSSPYSYKERKSRHHESQSNGSHHYRVKDNCSRDRVRHRGDYKDNSTRSYRRNDDNEDYSRSRNQKFDSKRTSGFDMAPPVAASFSSGTEGNIGLYVPPCYSWA